MTLTEILDNLESELKPLALFFRHGEQFSGKPAFENGKPYTVRTSKCYRCGGRGGSDKWAHTGWTCYQCGGNGRGPAKTFKLYSAEQLAKLNATADKRRVKKQAAADAAAAKAQADADARRATFLEQFGALLESAAQYESRSEFIRDIRRKAFDRAELTGPQADALAAAVAKFAAGDARKAASGYVGTAGERIELTVTAERVMTFESRFGLFRIASMRDADGNAIVSKGSYVPPTASFDRERDRWTVTAESFRIRATIKGHDVYNGERQTVIQRVADIETKQTESVS